MLNVIIFLLVLSVLVLVHEIGHFIAARIVGIKAEEFGYGFPPRAIGIVKANGHWKRVAGRDRGAYKSTIWSLNWLPLGGFVRLKGEQGEGAGDPDSFISKNGWQKMFVLAAGVTMNWILAASIFSVGFMIGVPTDLYGVPSSATIHDRHIEISEVVPSSGAASAGLKAGDTVLEVNSRLPMTSEEVRDLLKTDEAGKKFTIRYRRDGIENIVEAQTAFLKDLNRPGLGVLLSDVGTVSFPPHRAIVQGVLTTTAYTWLIVSGLFTLIRDLVTFAGPTPDVSGPLGIAVLTGQVAKRGVWALAHFTALLSLNLAVINFLPIPALDGGRAMFVLVESLRRRRNNPVFESVIHQIGFTVLLILILLVTVQDLRRYGGAIWRGLLGIVGFQ